jgi:hypothetical protein
LVRWICAISANFSFQSYQCGTSPTYTLTIKKLKKEEERKLEKGVRRGEGWRDEIHTSSLGNSQKRWRGFTGR